MRYDGDYRMYMERDEDLQEKLEARYVAGSKGIQSVRAAPRPRARPPWASRPRRPRSASGAAKMAGVSGRQDGMQDAKRINA